MGVDNVGLEEGSISVAVVADVAIRIHTAQVHVQISSSADDGVGVKGNAELWTVVANGDSLSPFLFCQSSSLYKRSEVTGLPSLVTVVFLLVISPSLLLLL